MARSYRKLTRAAVRHLSPGAALTEGGIRFERLVTGEGVWSVNVMVDRQRIHRVIGRESEGTTRTHAEQFLERVRREAREGRLVLPRGRKVALTVASAAQQYLTRQQELGDRDARMKERRLRLHLVPFFGALPLARLAPFDIERYKAQRRSESAQPSTINRELAVLSHLLTRAVEWRWLSSRPVRIVRYRETPTRTTYLTVPHIEQLLEAAAADDNPQVLPFIMIGLGTGMRMAEMLQIRWEDIDTRKRLLTVHHAKAGRREQPMTAELATFLATWGTQAREQSPWLFPSRRSRTGHTVNIAKAFRRVVTAAGLDAAQVVRHTLRHTAITHLVQAGVDLPTVQRISGHKTLRMVQRYAHQSGQHVASAMEKLSERYAKGC